MTDAAIALDLDQTLDIQRGVAAQIALDDEILVDVVADERLLVLGEILYAGIGIDLCRVQDLGGRAAADAVDIGEANFNSDRKSVV